MRPFLKNDLFSVSGKIKFENVFSMKCISCSVYVNINYLSLRINLRKILRLLDKTFFKRSTTKVCLFFGYETRKLACFRYHMKNVLFINLDEKENKLFSSRIILHNRRSCLQNIEIHSLVEIFHAEHCTDLMFLKAFHIVKGCHFHYIKIYRLISA